MVAGGSNRSPWNDISLGIRYFLHNLQLFVGKGEN